MQTDRNKRPVNLRKPAAGLIIGLLALLSWSNRATVSAWFATSYTASIRLTTTTEVDDKRLERAFEVTRAKRASEATLELIPGLRHIRDSVVHVPGASRGEAIGSAEAFSRDLAAAFDAGGSGHLDVRVRPRADPAPGAANRTVLAMLTLGVPVLGGVAIALLWFSWRDWRAARGDDLPPGAGYAVAGGLSIAIAPFVVPGWLFMAIFAMTIPGSIAGMIVYKTRELHRAAQWPSAPGRIVRARPRAVEREQSDGSTTVSNLPDIEYAYSVDGVDYTGKRIGIGEISPGDPAVEAALDRYRVGTTGPVYYNPARPNEAVLERDAPASPTVLYAVAAGVLLVGFTVVIAFTRIGEIIDWLQPYFPPGAVVPGVLFCLAAGLLTLLFLLSNRRDAMKAAGWPTVTGTVLTSEARSRRVLAPGGGNQTMVLWSPLVEYGYRVGERDYHGARVAFGPTVSGGRDLAEATVARYPAGGTVTVHYDPANPSMAVIETRVSFSWMSLLVTTGFFAAAIFFSGWRW